MTRVSLSLHLAPLQLATSHIDIVGLENFSYFLNRTFLLLTVRNLYAGINLSFVLCPIYISYFLIT